jgi:hypothetical protein
VAPDDDQPQSRFRRRDGVWTSILTPPPRLPREPTLDPTPSVLSRTFRRSRLPEKLLSNRICLTVLEFRLANDIALNRLYGFVSDDASDTNKVRVRLDCYHSHYGVRPGPPVRCLYSLYKERYFSYRTPCLTSLLPPFALPAWRRTSSAISSRVVKPTMRIVNHFRKFYSHSPASSGHNL